MVDCSRQIMFCSKWTSLHSVGQRGKKH